jgi:hypothetical protein
MSVNVTVVLAHGVHVMIMPACPADVTGPPLPDMPPGPGNLYSSHDPSFPRALGPLGLAQDFQSFKKRKNAAVHKLKTSSQRLLQLCLQLLPYS